MQCAFLSRTTGRKLCWVSPFASVL
jgi:hypothetical protein